jgi:hypothetical protein
VAGGRAHAAAQHDRIERPLLELVGEPLDVGCPLGEQQAVTAPIQRGDHVVDDLGEAGVVGHEIAVDGRHTAGLGGVDVAEVGVGGVVHAEHGRLHRAGWSRLFRCQLQHLQQPSVSARNCVVRARSCASSSTSPATFAGWRSSSTDPP